MTSGCCSERARTALVVYAGKHGPTATQKISFAEPFNEAAGEIPFRIVFQTHLSDAEAILAAFSDHSPDLLVLSRYVSHLGEQWIALARAAGIPIIFHIDDDLLAVPPSLGPAKFAAYNDPERRKALRDNIEASDLLYVSTEELGKRFGAHAIETPIIAGRIYCSVAPNEIGATEPPATGPVIGYMGTSGHSQDLAMVIPSVCEVMEAIPNLQFELFGTIAMPAELTEFGQRVRHLAPIPDYSDFLPYLRRLGWWIGLAPLEDNPFNRCKADTKWVEYSLAGIAVIASDLPVYERACAGGSGILARDRREWTRALIELLVRPPERSAMVESAQRKLRERYTHEKLRQQVMNVFDQALTANRRAGAQSLKRPQVPASAGEFPRPAR